MGLTYRVLVPYDASTVVPVPVVDFAMAAVINKFFSEINGLPYKGLAGRFN